MNTRNDAASAYRQFAARGASQLGQVVVLYDSAIQSFHQALRAIGENNIEQRTKHLNHALTVIALLQSSLDFEKGGQVALQLERFYNFNRGRVLEASIKSSSQILKEIISHFQVMRDAWTQVDTAESTPPPVTTAYAETALS